jgi:hypothetical protein
MRGAIVLADVRLDLDDPRDPDGPRAGTAVLANESRAEQAPTGLERWPGQQLPQAVGQWDVTGTSP